jgi:hypothetical protein
MPADRAAKTLPLIYIHDTMIPTEGMVEREEDQEAHSEPTWALSE